MATIQPPVFNRNALVQITHSDFIHRLDEKGKVAKLAELLEETNEMLLDMEVREANGIDYNTVNVRTSLPKAYFRGFNEGVPPSKSSSATVRDHCGMIRAQSEVDPDLIALNGNAAAFRDSEDDGFRQSLNITMQHEMIYGDTAKNPKGFDGFLKRYNTLKVDEVTPQAKNVIDCSAGNTQATDLTSIWVVNWGENVYGFYPKGSAAGLEVKDLGQQMVLDQNGNNCLKYVTMYDWKLGLSVRDWRNVVRLCNISLSDLLNNTGIGTANVRDGKNTTNLILKLQDAISLIPGTARGHMAIYCNADVHSALNQLAARADSNVITLESGLNRHGEHWNWRTFMGVPLRRVDQIVNNETRVTK